MENQLLIHDSLKRKKVPFQPLHPTHVGLYVCGPTVYGDPHLGHARMGITFDLVFRYLTHLGFKVRYVRNITDVGHLESDADQGEDKIGKKARLEELEPMEVVQQYTNSYHRAMRRLNILEPSIEPLASGHIIEQQQFIEKILQKNMAYEVNGSVYFDVDKYNESHRYGILSGRNIDDLRNQSRDLEGQEEKKNPYDFALWKNASKDHLMKWPSKWGLGFPGWHLECSTMSTRYLGEEFDIHGGGMDLLFPHHECEIAQSTAVHGKSSVRYWMHNNMITLNGQKMGRSLGNAVTLEEFFTGNHEVLEQAYHPMTIRFFMLQAHYRGTLDFTNKALQAAEKGLERLFRGMEELSRLKPSNTSSLNVRELEKKCYEALNDDFNSPILISHMFDGIKDIFSIGEGRHTISSADLDLLKTIYHTFVTDILGLKPESDGSHEQLNSELVEAILNIRLQAKANKDFETSDRIRDALNTLGIDIKDSKDGYEWAFRKKQVE